MAYLMPTAGRAGVTRRRISGIQQTLPPYRVNPDLLRYEQRPCGGAGAAGGLGA